MVVRTNVLALNSHRNLGNVANQQARASARLSSGFRINSAADDAAGLGISENMRSQIRGLDQASRNSQDAISLIQTAEGGLNTINDMVIRIRELVVQAANDTNTADDAGTTAAEGESNRSRIQAEITQLVQEIDRTADTLEFNNRNLLGTASQTFTFQVGANQGQTLEITMPNMRGAGSVHQSLHDTLVGANGTNIQNATGSTISGMLDSIDSQLSRVTTQRGNLGAMQNRLEFTIQNLDVSSENLSAANSRIRDTDMAAEMMRLTQANVLQQAATAMLAQGNQAPQSILQLLG